MNAVRRLKVYVLGQRDYPEAVVTVPEHLVEDLPDHAASADSGACAGRARPRAASGEKAGASSPPHHAARTGDDQRPVHTCSCSGAESVAVAGAPCTAEGRARIDAQRGRCAGSSRVTRKAFVTEARDDCGSPVGIHALRAVVIFAGLDESPADAV
jgi:hypothetical protein